MVLSKFDIMALRKRLEKTDGGIKGAVALVNLTEQTGNKILHGGNCRTDTIEAFIEGVRLLELKENEIRALISQKAQTPAVAV